MRGGRSQEHLGALLTKLPLSGKKGRRKARKTDASDLTPNPQKLHNIGEQLQKLHAAIEGMGPVSELPAVARARSRKEKNKLASR